MEAFILKKPGGIENLIRTELSIPELKAGEVLVKVSAISINPVDAFVRASNDALNYILKPQDGEPIIVGWDISGTISKVGNAVSGFTKGDEVFGLVNFIGHGKGYAEYVAVPAYQLALKPKNISHQEAAAATLAAITAYGSLVTYAKVKSGDKVLIHAAAGGVGHYAVQIAKYLGAYVIGIGSAGSKNFILGLGADEFLDYKNQVFENVITDADVVIDSIPNNPTHIERSLNALKNSGRLISLITFFNDPFKEKLKAKNVFGHRFSVESDGEAMKVIADWLSQGILKSTVSQEFSFENLPKSHTQIETGKTKGKIIVTL